MQPPPHNNNTPRPTSNSSSRDGGSGDRSEPTQPQPAQQLPHWLLAGEGETETAEEHILRGID